MSGSPYNRSLRHLRYRNYRMRNKKEKAWKKKNETIIENKFGYDYIITKYSIFFRRVFQQKYDLIIPFSLLYSMLSSLASFSLWSLLGWVPWYSSGLPDILPVGGYTASSRFLDWFWCISACSLFLTGVLFVSSNLEGMQL